MTPSDAKDAPVRLQMSARLENVPRLIEATLAAARTLSQDDERLGDLELALEECLVNIVHYAYADAAPGTIDLTCWRQAGRFVVQIEDQGRAFDPTAAPDPDLASDLEKRPIGGLGVHLVRRLMDDVQYRRRDRRNCLTLIVHLPGPEAPS